MEESRSAEHDIVAVPLRHPGRWISATVLLVLFVALLSSLWTNPNVQHDIVSEFFLDGRIFNGVWITILITALSMIVGTLLAVIFAVMRMSANPILRTLAWLYVWFFRGTPLLVQIVFWGYLGLLYSQISAGIPFTEIQFFSVDTNTLIPAFVGGVIALSLNEGAYAAEIVRAGMLSIDNGQREAAYSLGMSPGYTLRRIILPQAMKVIIPPMGNETISMLKSTSLLVIVAVPELYTAATQISSNNLAQVELLVVASAWYLIMTSILSIPQYYLERRYGRGAQRQLPPTPIQQLKTAVGHLQARAASRRAASGRR